MGSVTLEVETRLVLDAVIDVTLEVARGVVIDEMARGFGMSLEVPATDTSEMPRYLFELEKSFLLLSSLKLPSLSFRPWFSSSSLICLMLVGLVFTSIFPKELYLF